MLATNPLAGVCPVVIMPYLSNDDISFDELASQIHYLFNVGCQGAVVGQVSEVSRLTTNERFRVAELLARECNGRGASVMSTGGESIKEALEFSKQAESCGCDVLLLMHPTIMALDDEQMFKYFASVIEEVDIPVMIHHAKSLAKRPVSIDVQVRLATEFGHEKVWFKPEAAPTPPRVTLLRDATEGKARIFEGDGGMMLVDTFQRGASGVITATEIAPITVALWKALQSGEERIARKIGYPLSYLMSHMMTSIDCYLGIAKHILVKRGLMKLKTIREPIDFFVDAETLSEVERVFEDLDRIVSDTIDWEAPSKLQDSPSAS